MDLTGAVKSVLDYCGEQSKERRAMRREERREESEREKVFIGAFFKYFAILCAVVMGIWLIAQAFGLFG